MQDLLYNEVMDIEFKTLQSLEFNKVLEKLSNFAKTEQSKELCLTAKIFNNKKDIEEQL